jgi:hypothetical protein
VDNLGITYDARIDGKRIGGQRESVLRLMLDHRWRTLAEIEAITGYPQASVSARLRDFRKAQYGFYTVNRRRRTEGTREYQVLNPAFINGRLF